MADLCQRYVRISIHALLAESDIQQLGGQTGIFISIHALLAESDGTQLTVADVYKISIHALLAESDNWPRVMNPLCLYFYPRSPCGERLRRSASIWLYRYFYPRSPCGERLPHFKSSWPHSCNFYPRSPCGERPLAKVRHCEGYVFLSTLSLRRATIHFVHLRKI